MTFKVSLLCQVGQIGSLIACGVKEGIRGSQIVVAIMFNLLFAYSLASNETFGVLGVLL